MDSSEELIVETLIQRIIDLGKPDVIVTNPSVHEELGIGYVRYTLGSDLTGKSIVIEDDYRYMGVHGGEELYLARRI